MNLEGLRIQTNAAGTIFCKNVEGEFVAKSCTKCKKIKTVDCFKKHKKCMGEMYSECSECQTKTRSNVLFVENSNGEVVIKQCHMCLELKDVNDFREHNSGLGGRWFKCIECEKMQNEYNVQGEITTIIIESEKYGRFEAMIDTEDFERVREARTWFINPSNNPGRKSFYVHGYLGDGKTVQLHRYLLGVDDPGQIIDHINRNPLDNRKSNLNLVTQAENMQNTSIRCDNKSGHTGVSWNKRKSKWRAYITVDKSKQISLGYYDELDRAIEARKIAEQELFVYKRSIEEVKETISNVKHNVPFSKYVEFKQKDDSSEAM